MPTMILCWSSIRACMAASPSRLANMRSLALGAPPRCRCPRIETLTSYPGYSLFYPVGIVHGSAILIARAFRHDDDAAVLGLPESASDKSLQLIRIRPVFRNNGGLGSRGYCAVLGEETGVASHHLDKENSVVRGGCIPDFVHTLHNGVQGRIISDCKIGTVQVIVDGTGQSYARDRVFLGKYAGSSQ